MPRFLMSTLGTDGDLLPFLRLAERLVENDASVVLLLNPADVARAERRGLSALAVGAHVDFQQAIRERPELMGPRGGVIVVREIYVPHCAEQLIVARRLLDEEKYDAVICHPMGLGLAWAAAERGVPIAAVHPAPMSLFTSEDDGHMPGWMRILMRAVLPAGRAQIRRWLRPIAAANGVPRELASMWEGPMAPDLTLGLWSPSLQGMAERSDVRAVGFPSPPEGPLPSELASFLAAGSPPVAVALGTSAVHSAGTLPRRVVRACRDLEQRVVVFGDWDGGEAPGGDVLVVRRAPYGSVFPRCAAVVHHGGIGACAAGLWSGIPALVTPFAHDQPDNAYRLQRLGNRQARPASSVRRLRAELQALLAPEAAERAREQGASLQAEGDGTSRAADLLIELARTCAPRARP